MTPSFEPVRLAARGLALARGERRLARDIAFDLAPGDALVVRGPNGSGKSTLLRVLAGFLSPADGEVTLAAAVDGEPREDAAVAAYLGHADGLAPFETPRAHVAFFARWLGGGGEDAALARFGADRYADRPARRLSAGQKRRAALARVAASGRPLWLLDEPAAPLDAAGREALAAVVAAHRDAGGLVIAATHDAFDWPAASELDLGNRR